MMRIIWFAILVSLSIGPDTARAYTSSVQDDARIARIESGLLPAVSVRGQPLARMKLSDRMRFYKVPGVSIAFFERGKITWTRTYGFADALKQRPITPETLFEAGSISKPTTALAALRLVQDGKLTLDEDVNTRLIEWKVPANVFTKDQRVTLRRLLSHTAGLNVHGFEGYLATSAVPTITQILDGLAPSNTKPIRVITVPGSNWRYSGGGYVVVQLLISEAEDAPFAEVLSKTVLSPAGMSHSTFQQPLPPTMLSEAAMPFDSDGNPIHGGPRVYPEMAAAGLWTTPSDLSQMMIEVQNEYAGRSSRILSQSMAHQMLARERGNWGLGFSIAKPGHAIHFGHGGSDVGFESRVEAYIGSGEGVAIMTNGARGDELIREVLCSVAAEYNWPDFRPEQHTVADVDLPTLSKYAGTYKLADGTTINLILRAGRLYAEGIDTLPLEMLPETSTHLFTLTDTTRLKFAIGPNGDVTALTVQDGSEELAGYKIAVR